jgi:NADH dehydrogenase
LVGGGPTGVELAGALAEMKKAILQKVIRSRYFEMQINLIQSESILNTMKNHLLPLENFSEFGSKIWKNACD